MTFGDLHWNREMTGVQHWAGQLRSAIPNLKLGNIIENKVQSNRRKIPSKIKNPEQSFKVSIFSGLVSKAGFPLYGGERSRCLRLQSTIVTHDYISQQWKITLLFYIPYKYFLI